MDAKELLTIVRELDDDQPLHKRLEQELEIGSAFGRAWYATQKEHWIKWLSDYHTPGPYGRNVRVSTPARTVYNRVMCPPMAFWLAEAVCVPEELLLAAYRSATTAPRSCASQTAAIRNTIPWTYLSF